MHQAKYNTAARIFFVLFFALTISEGVRLVTYMIEIGPYTWFPRVFVVWLFATVITGFLSFLRETPTQRIALIATLAVIANVMIYVLNYDDLGPDILIIATAAVAHRLGLLRKRPIIVLAVLLGSVFLVRFISGLQNGSLNLFRKVNQSILTLGMGAFLYWIFEDDIVTLKREKQLMQREMDSIVPFAEFGRNSAGIVHDFKNDAALFSALTSVTRQSLGEPIDQNLVSRLEHVTQRLSDRIQLILTATSVYSRSSEDLGQEQQQFFDLHHTVQASIYPFSASLIFRTVLEVHPLNTLRGTTVRGRPDLLIAILENLIRNSCEAALEHAAPDAPLVTVHAPSSREVIVEDNGKGLPFCQNGCVHENCLFCPQIRLGVTTKEQGSGLGMHRIAQAAERLGVEVTIKSQRNKGIIATVRIPESIIEGV